jgi:hypothetical protein
MSCLVQVRKVRAATEVLFAALTFFAEIKQYICLLFHKKCKSGSNFV